MLGRPGDAGIEGGWEGGKGIARPCGVFWVVEGLVLGIALSVECAADELVDGVDEGW